jgi:hypothetical protein
MSLRPKTAILLAALALLALPASAMALERTVSVEGSATLTVPNDSAGVGLSVSLQRGSRAAALRAASAKLHAVIAAVQAIPGVGAADVRTGRISVHKSPRGGATFYRASEGIGVTLHQPERAGELVSAAIVAGATGVRGPNFFVGDTEAASTKALTAAFEKAKARAAALAAAAGASLGQVLSIDEGGGAEFLPGATEKGASGCAVAPTPAPAPVKRANSSACTTTPPTKPGTSTVTATVRVVFALQ